MTTSRSLLRTTTLALAIVGAAGHAHAAARGPIPIRVTVKRQSSPPTSGQYIVPLSAGQAYQREALEKALHDAANRVKELQGAKRYELTITGATSAHTREGLHGYRLVDQVTANVHLHDD